MVGPNIEWPLVGIVPLDNQFCTPENTRSEIRNRGVTNVTNVKGVRKIKQKIMSPQLFRGKWGCKKIAHPFYLKEDTNIKYFCTRTISKFRTRLWRPQCSYNKIRLPRVITCSNNPYEILSQSWRPITVALVWYTIISFICWGRLTPDSPTRNCIRSLIPEVRYIIMHYKDATGPFNVILYATLSALFHCHSKCSAVIPIYVPLLSVFMFQSIGTVVPPLL